MPNQGLLSVTNVAPGAAVYLQGETGDRAYMVLSGRISLSREVGNRALPMAVVERRGLFGEVDLHDCGIRTATAIAVTQTSLSTFDGREIRGMMSGSGVSVRAMVGLLVENIRYLEDNVPRPNARLSKLIRALYRCSSDLHRHVIEERQDRGRLDEIGRRLAILDKSVEQFAAGLRLGTALLVADKTRQPGHAHLRAAS